MGAFATLLAALALAQGEPVSPKPMPIPIGGIPDESAPRVPEQEAPPADEAPPRAAPPDEPAPPAPRQAPPAATTAPPPAPAPPAPRPDPAPARPRVTPPPLPAPSPPAPPSAAPVSQRPPPAPAPAEPRPSSTAAPGPASAPQIPSEPEADQVAKAARAFLEALRASDADGLAAAAAEEFSFDGEPRVGAEEIRRAWRELFSRRTAPAPLLGDVVLLPAAEAIARHGKPPPRIAGLVRPGVWVAIASLGGRPVVLFLAKDGGRIAVRGMHD